MKSVSILTITGSAPSRGGRAFVTYRCQCGKTGERRADQAAKAISCGCLRKEKARALMAARIVDLSGVRFGRLVVVDRHAAAGRVRWNCVCDCGGKALVMSENLRSGNTCSCGCARREKIPVRDADVRARKNDAVKRRYREDVRFAIDARVRASVHKHLRSVGETKSKRMREILGYGAEQLQSRLLETMPKGCDWADFLSGGLQIDHIIPLSAFNFERLTDFDFRRAWALDNLQLLHSAENIKKSDSLDGHFQPSLLF